MANLTSPPKARLAFRVGISGHRPNRLKNASLPMLSALLRDVLSSVRNTVGLFQEDHPSLYRDSPPLLRAISSLAEGTDRILAEEAISLGFELCCPLPFAQEEFELDFRPGEALEEASLGRFRSLLDRARRGPGLVTFALKADRFDVGGAYRAASRVLLNQSDLLVVVWDGGDAAGKGGTADTLKEAMAFRIPVLWIDAFAPHAWCILEAEKDLPIFHDGERCCPASHSLSISEAIRDVVRTTIEFIPPPTEPRGNRRLPSTELQEDFFLERKPKWNFALVWKFFRDALGSGRLSIQHLRVPDFEAAVDRDWPVEPSSPAGKVARWINGCLRSHYAWADKLADYYADAYRSAFVLSYPLAALAVIFALIPVAAHGAFLSASFQNGFVFGELGLILIVLFLFYRGRKRRWHDRWMDYRLLAELVRELRFLIPLGGGRPFPRQPVHLETYGHPARTWMFWHMRAIAREVGIPDVTIDDAYLRECLIYLRDVISGQVHFHEENWRRSEKIEHRLHRGAMILLFATAICIAAHFLPGGESLKAWLIIGTAGFPAMGAALAGILNQGEFARLARRSRAMSERLERLADEIRAALTSFSSAADAARPTISDVSPLAIRAAEFMVDEVLDWRVVFLDRPLVPPA